MTVAMTVNEANAEDFERAAPMTVTRFLVWSVLTALVATAAAYGIQMLRELPPQPGHLLFAAVSGFAVSSAGWLIVLRGFRDDPARIFAYFGAGLLAKLLLLALTIGLVTGLKLVPQSEFLIPFATVFFLTGFAQLGITVKGATKLLEQAPKSGPSRNPAAPGAAVDPKERG